MSGARRSAGYQPIGQFAAPATYQAGYQPAAVPARASGGAATGLTQLPPTGSPSPFPPGLPVLATAVSKRATTFGKEYLAVRNPLMGVGRQREWLSANGKAGKKLIELYPHWYPNVPAIFAARPDLKPVTRARVTPTGANGQPFRILNPNDMRLDPQTNQWVGQAISYGGTKFVDVLRGLSNDFVAIPEQTGQASQKFQRVLAMLQTVGVPQQTLERLNDDFYKGNFGKMIKKASNNKYIKIDAETYYATILRNPGDLDNKTMLTQGQYADHLAAKKAIKGQASKVFLNGRQVIVTNPFNGNNLMLGSGTSLSVMKANPAWSDAIIAQARSFGVDENTLALLVAKSASAAAYKPALKAASGQGRASAGVNLHSITREVARLSATTSTGSRRGAQPQVVFGANLGQQAVIPAQGHAAALNYNSATSGPSNPTSNGFLQATRQPSPQLAPATLQLLPPTTTAALFGQPAPAPALTQAQWQSPNGTMRTYNQSPSGVYRSPGGTAFQPAAQF